MTDTPTSKPLPIPLHPYTPGEKFIIPEADPGGAPISGNPSPTPQGQDTDKANDQQP
jgi:hypothetical protein